MSSEHLFNIVWFQPKSFAFFAVIELPKAPERHQIHGAGGLAVRRESSTAPRPPTPLSCRAVAGSYAVVRDSAETIGGVLLFAGSGSASAVAIPFGKSLRRWCLLHPTEQVGMRFAGKVKRDAIIRLELAVPLASQNTSLRMAQSSHWRWYQMPDDDCGRKITSRKLNRCSPAEASSYPQFFG